MEKPYLSVIIPCFDEETNLSNGVLPQLAAYLKKQKYSWEVIIVDDGSRDKSIHLLQKFNRKNPQFKLLKISHQGKAQAIKTGVFRASGKYLLFTDMDQATPISEIEKLFQKINRYHIVIGSREGEGAKRENETWYRHLMGRVFNFIVKIITGLKFNDTQCGFKLFQSEAAKKIFKSLKVYKKLKTKDAFTGAFDVEVLFLAKKMGYKVAEVPIHWCHIKTSRVNPLKDSLRMFRDVIKIRLCSLKP